jgi:hypothetical protein
MAEQVFLFIDRFSCQKFHSKGANRLSVAEKLEELKIFAEIWWANQKLSLFLIKNKRKHIQRHKKKLSIESKNPFIHPRELKTFSFSGAYQIVHLQLTMRHSVKIMENSCKCTTDTHSKTKIECGSSVKLHFHFNFLAELFVLLFIGKVERNLCRVFLFFEGTSGSPRGNLYECSF